MILMILEAPTVGLRGPCHIERRTPLDTNPSFSLLAFAFRPPPGGSRPSRQPRGLFAGMSPRLRAGRLLRFVAGPMSVEATKTRAFRVGLCCNMCAVLVHSTSSGGTLGRGWAESTNSYGRHGWEQGKRTPDEMPLQISICSNS